MKIGIDATNIYRFSDKTCKLAKFFLASTEWDYFVNLNDSKRQQGYLAGRFALKEAIIKVLSQPVPLKKIEILLVNNQLLVKIDHKLQTQLALSLTHTDDLAIAVCISN